MRWLSKAFGAGHPSIKAPPARTYPTIPDTWPIQRRLNAWNDRVSELLATFGAAPEAVEAAHQRSLDLMDLLVDRNLDGKVAAKPFLFFTTTFPGLEVSEATWADWDEAYGLFHDIASANEPSYA